MAIRSSKILKWFDDTIKAQERALEELKEHRAYFQQVFETARASTEFVKLPRNELPPRGSPERKAYRKARRASARMVRLSVTDGAFRVT